MATSVNDFQQPLGKTDVPLLVAMELLDVLTGVGINGSLGEFGVQLRGAPLHLEEGLELVGDLCLLNHHR